MENVRVKSEKRASGSSCKWLLYLLLTAALLGLIVGGGWAYVLNANEYFVNIRSSNVEFK